MPYEHLSRHERRAMVAFSAQESKKRPAVLSEIPRNQWPMNQTKQTHVWHSRKFLVQMFDETPFQGIDTRRISVSRVTLLESGRWEEGISWEDLMRVKREIFPRDADIVNVANMRHLWLLAVPLNLGWFRSQSENIGS